MPDDVPATTGRIDMTQPTEERVHNEAVRLVRYTRTHGKTDAQREVQETLSRLLEKRCLT